MYAYSKQQPEHKMMHIAVFRTPRAHMLSQYLQCRVTDWGTVHGVRLHLALDDAIGFLDCWRRGTTCDPKSCLSSVNSLTIVTMNYMYVATLKENTKRVRQTFLEAILISTSIIPIGWPTSTPRVGMGLQVRDWYAL